MKKILTVVVIFALAVILVGCTDQSRAKGFGGTAIINLPKGEKLVNATWKDENIWYLTRPMRENENAEKYSFKESSSFGLLQGEVILQESK